MSQANHDIQEAVRRFMDFFSTLSEESVRTKIRNTYAADVHFNDTLKEIHGIEPLERYLVESARAVDSCTVELEDVAVSGENIYVRWTMEIRFKRLEKGTTTRSIGMSHLKLGADGKIAFHQDYWDSSAGLFEHIPLVGFLIRRIKQRL